LSEEEAGGAEWVGFDELLAQADVLSLNLPLNVSLAGGVVFFFSLDAVDCSEHLGKAYTQGPID
jgi:lactate dehydrogenase-like 2-hydroxyacid dehydrogenase